MYTVRPLLLASDEVNFHPLGVPVAMTAPAELTGSTASVLLFAPVASAANPAPRALSVALVHWSVTVGFNATVRVPDLT